MSPSNTDMVESTTMQMPNQECHVDSVEDKAKATFKMWFPYKLLLKLFSTWVGIPIKTSENFSQKTLSPTPFFVPEKKTKYQIGALVRATFRDQMTFATMGPVGSQG